MPDALYLIDGHAQIFRAYYAPFGDLTSPSGEPTRATYVFMSMLFRLLQERRPEYWAVALDSRDASASRRELFSEYKTNRDETPEDLLPQIRRIESLLRLMGVPVLQLPGFEADDVIATVARRLRDRPLDVYVVGTDKDLEQLIGGGVCLFDPAKNTVLDARGLEESKGYRPSQVIEIQTLMGDKIDNIPGIQGVGIKTAVRLIGQYGSARAVLEHADELTPRLRENVRAFAEQMPVTRKLVTLRDDLDLDFDLQEARYCGVAADRLRPVFMKLGFTRLTDQLERPELVEGRPKRSEGHTPELVEGDSPELVEGQHERSEAHGPGRSTGDSPELVEAKTACTLVDTPEALAELASGLRGTAGWALDVASVGRPAIEARLVGLGVTGAAGQAAYVPLCAAMGRTLSLEQVREHLGPLLADASRLKVGHDLKPQLLVLEEHGLLVNGPLFDTLIASFLLSPLRQAHTVERVALELWSTRLMPLSDVVGKGRGRLDLDQVETTRAAVHRGQQVDFAWRLYEHFRPQIEDGALRGLFEDIEMPLLWVLAAMERQGVALDVAMLARIGEQLQGRLDDLSVRIHELAGHPFNIDSPRQLAEVLFDEIGLRVVRKTRTGRSTDAESLSTLVAESGHPLPEAVLEYRELVKLKSTYTDALPRLVSKKTGRIHASFNTTGAVTGRLSSNDPNLQNIPVRTATGREIRKAFVAAAPDALLLSADYSQIELRLLAHFCQDQRLVQAFHDDEDIHRAVAAQIFDVPQDQVQPEHRARAKAVNFGIIYGQSPFGLSRTTGMTVGEARQFINMYFMRYPGIRLFIDACVENGERDGFVSTIAGRRRPLPELGSRNRQKRQLGERLAINTVLQGSAADLIKLAMVRIHARAWPPAARPTMLVQVHDELVFEVPVAGVQETAAAIADDMATALPLRVPLKVDVGWGANWLECKT